MLYKRLEIHSQLCVLRVSADVFDLPNVIIADGNASSDWTAFMPSPKGLEIVDADLVFAEYWPDPDPIVQYRKKRVKCAEVLVPKKVDPKYIIGAYVSCEEAKIALVNAGIDIPITINPHLFFMAT